MEHPLLPPRQNALPIWESVGAGETLILVNRVHGGPVGVEVKVGGSTTRLSLS